MSITYREAVANDARALLEYTRVVGGETDNLSFGKDTFNISEEREAKFIDRFYKSKKDIMLVACDGERIVANASLERKRVERYSHRAELSITVLSKYWGRGIGSELMKMLIEFAKESGIEIIYLDVRADNERAKGLYRKFGFELIGTFKGYFKINGSYFDGEFMQLCL